MRIVLIRHGITPANEKKAYHGLTDDHLSDEGRHRLYEQKEQLDYPKADMVVISSLIRTRETAEILYPGFFYQVVPDFREIDFGEFEGKTDEELCDDSRYIEWMKSLGVISFPGGENMEMMQKRCRNAFLELMGSEMVRKLEAEKEDPCIAFVVHGGTIMALMSTLCEKPKGYFEYMVSNGCGYKGIYKDGKIMECSKIS